MEVRDKTTEIQRIVERVQTFMPTHYGTIKRESKLKEKVKALRTQLTKRMTEIQTKILTIVELDPRDEDSVSKARELNTETVELQRLSLDEIVLTLILRKDMSDNDLKRDRELRAERHERVNRTLDKASRWVEEIPTLEDGTVLELSMLASEDVPPTDDEYDNTIIRATIDHKEQEIVQQVYEQEDLPDSRARDVSQEPENHPQAITSTPRRSPFSMKEEEVGTKRKKQVSYDLPEQEGEKLETIWTSGVQKGSEPRMTAAQGNGVYSHPGYNPCRGEEAAERLRGVPHLKPHEQEFYRLQNYYQTEVPLFPGGLGVGESPSNLNEETIMQSVHSKDDGPFTGHQKSVE